MPSNHNFCKLAVALLCILFTSQFSHAQNNPAKADTSLNDQSFVTWVKAHAVPLQQSDSAIGNADLLPVKQMIGKARILALGESAHGRHEPLAFRNRLFKYLVENDGFTTIVVEAGLAEAKQAGDYVAGGKGTAYDAAAKLTIATPFPETVALLEWMRTYNADPTHKVKLKFCGMDLQLIGVPGETKPSHAALDEALAYLNQVDPKSAEKMKAIFGLYADRLSAANYPKLSADEQNKLSLSLDALIALFEKQKQPFIKASSKQQYDWAYRNALVARQTDQLVRATPPDIKGSFGPGAWKGVVKRDSAMAENVRWILEQANGGKVMVYAHNGHVKNSLSKGGRWDILAQAPGTMGQYLKRALGKDLFIIGTSAGATVQMSQPNSLDRSLIKVDIPRYLLNLHEILATQPAHKWLSLERSMVENTVFFILLKPIPSFDAILFMNKNER